MIWLIGLLISAPVLVSGDITVVKEIAVGPKSVNAAANIGTVNSSANVSLAEANVDVFVDPPQDKDKPSHYRGLLPLKIQAYFILVNESDKQLELTVGFPISNSEYSSFSLASFKVVTDRKVRDVFRRTSGYPRRLRHEFVSGNLGPERVDPPADVDLETMSLIPTQSIGNETFQNLMVWRENFLPKEKKEVKVTYELLIPLQDKKVIRKNIEGNYKGVWPQEANGVPLDFLQTLPTGSFYFFDYYLTSGASWAGPIGFEGIALHFDQWWPDVELYSSIGSEHFVWSDKTQHPGEPIVAFHSFENHPQVINISWG